MDFGLFDEASAEQAARSWIDVQHFFSAPYYVISYCVSNDAALQIYQLEQETPSAETSRSTSNRNGDAAFRFW